MAELTFNAAAVEPDAGAPEAVPAGWYIVAADQSENKPTKDGINTYTKFRFSILDGVYKGRKVFHNFNLVHTNPQTSEIAQRQLSALCHATGVLQLVNTEQLHGIPIKIKVGVREDPGYDKQNDIRSFKNVNEVTDASPAGTGTTVVTGAPPANPAFTPPPVGAAPPAAAQPWGQPPAGVAPAPAAPPAPAPAAPPAPPAAPAAPPPPPAFPPAGWTAHPSAPGYFYQGQEVVSEADLRARMMPAAPPAAPAAPPAPTAAQPWAGGPPNPGATGPGAPPAGGYNPPWVQPT